METVITLEKFISKEKERSYDKLPFFVPENICGIDIEYSYERHWQSEGKGTMGSRDANIIDIGLMDGDGRYIGSSGSERSHIHISGWDSTPGYAAAETKAGQWHIIVGAYLVAEEGVRVTYRITLTHKQRRLLRGDIHIHTINSDGSLTATEAAAMASEAGLDFIFITDHNNDSRNVSLPKEKGLTILPGMEWTHYEGHAGILGVGDPVRNAFCADTKEEAWDALADAREKGRLVILNHPFCLSCGWHFGMERECYAAVEQMGSAVVGQADYDAVELWNGDLEDEVNRKCVQWWHEKLCRGWRLPAVGGSDFHRFEAGHRIGAPSTCIYALSLAPADILSALQKGNGYIVMEPEGPSLYAEAAGRILGETAPRGSEVSVRFEGLRDGDRLRLITDRTMESEIEAGEICCKEYVGNRELCCAYPEAKFIRFEVWRNSREILISNPIYFG